MSLNQVNSSGELERRAGLVNSEKINEMYEAFPSDASASNKLLSYKSTQLYANYQSNNTRVVRIEYPSNLATRLHLITEPGAALRDIFIQVTTRNPFVNVYDMGASSLFTIKTADISNKRVIYINVGTSDGSVIINQDDIPTDGYGTLLLPTVTVTNTSDEEWTSATDITPIRLRPTSSITSGSTAPITSGGVYNALPKQYKTGGTGADFNTVMSALGLSGYPNKFAFEVFGSNANPCWAKGMVYRTSNSASCKMYYSSLGCTMASNVGGAVAVYNSDQSTPYSDATIVFTRID